MSLPSSSSLEEFPPLQQSNGPNSSPPRSAKKGTPRQTPVKKSNKPTAGQKQKKWATPKTPIFASNDQSNITNVTGAEPTPLKVPNPNLEPDSEVNPTTDAQSALLNYEPSIQSPPPQPHAAVNDTTVPAAASAEVDTSTTDPAASPSKAPSGLPGRRLSAYLQEKVDVYERFSREQSRDPSPVRHPRSARPSIISPQTQTGSAAASPAFTGRMGHAAAGDDLLLSPIVAVGDASEHGLHSLQASSADPHSGGVEQSEFMDGVDDPDIATEYFQTVIISPSSALQQGRISFGNMPDTSGTEEENDGFGEAEPSILLGDSTFSDPAHSTGHLSRVSEGNTGTIAASSGSLRAAINRPIFLGDEEEHDGGDMDDDAGNDDSMAQHDRQRDSTQQYQATLHTPPQPVLSTSHSSSTRSTQTPTSAARTSAASSDSVGRAVLQTPPASSIAPLVHPAPAPASVSSTSASFSPSAYFAARSAPLGSLSRGRGDPTVRRPTFRTPEYLTAHTKSGVVRDEEYHAQEIISPVNIAQVLRDRTPGSSRFTSPVSNNVSSSTTTVSSSLKPPPRSGSKIPLTTGAGASPAATFSTSVAAHVRQSLATMEAQRVNQSTLSSASSPNAAPSFSSKIPVYSGGSLATRAKESLTAVNHAASPAQQHTAVSYLSPPTASIGSGSRARLFAGGLSPSPIHPAAGTMSVVATPTSLSNTPGRAGPLTPHEIAVIGSSSSSSSRFVSPISHTTSHAQQMASTAGIFSGRESSLTYTTTTTEHVVTSPTPIPPKGHAGLPLEAAPRALLASSGRSFTATGRGSLPGSTLLALPAAGPSSSASSSVLDHSVRTNRASRPSSPVNTTNVSRTVESRASSSVLPASPIRSIRRSLSQSPASPIGIGIEQLREQIQFDAPYSSTPSTYHLDILVSSKIKHLHRFCMFEADPAVDPAFLQRMIESYVQSLYSSSSSSSLLVHRLLPHHNSTSTWTLLCAFDVSSQNQAAGAPLMSTGWMTEFLTQVASTCCGRIQSGAGSVRMKARDRSFYAVQFLEERPLPFHQQHHRS